MIYYIGKSIKKRNQLYSWCKKAEVPFVDAHPIGKHYTVHLNMWGTDDLSEQGQELIKTLVGKEMNYFEECPEGFVFGVGKLDSFVIVKNKERAKKVCEQLYRIGKNHTTPLNYFSEYSTPKHKKEEARP